jgi:adenosylhomocysteine nucleosidase
LNVVGIVCALRAEARHLGPTKRRQAPLAVLADGTLLAVNGMGAGAAAAGARALIDAGAGALVSFGLAGGLDPALAPGAILLPRAVFTGDGAPIATARAWCERLETALNPRSPVAHGALLTSTHAIATVAAKDALFRATGAVAVDMESYAIGQVAQAHRIPFLAVRVIVDGAGDRLPRPVAAAADGSGSLSLWRLLGALARAPSELASLLRLARRYRAASRSLAVVARARSLAPPVFGAGPGAAGL